MKFTPLLALTALVVAAPAAFAASTTDISVTGTITPAACTPTIAGGGNFDLGNISAADLKQDEETIRRKRSSFSVACEGPVRFALKTTDEKLGTATDSADPEFDFGLGMNGAEKIGRYNLVLSENIVDGVADRVFIVSSDDGLTWQSGGSTLVQEVFNYQVGNRIIGLTTGSVIDGPSAITNLSANIHLDVRIAPAKELTLTDDVQIDGASVIEVKYL
ncbi:DUF1120 domain-containing protein [Pseudomonas akapageensis]|uniref:DUF1120 domain-containing protein n=1 Tax=Pseudomonas akapageensis TaxID=2609961 RepID=UPI00140E3FFF|nr:DUF1120 domain-containing protein [Pseudomonas akapageensis]